MASVISNLWEEPKEEDKKKGAKPVLTVVRAPHLVYTDENRLAVYTGGVQLTRPNMLVKSQELRAYLADPRRRFPPRKGLCRWRRADRPDRPGPHPHRHRRAQRILHRRRRVILRGGQAAAGR